MRQDTTTIQKSNMNNRSSLTRRASLRTIILHKRPDHPFFGIYLANDVPSGLYVVTIEPNSPAANVQIQPGDHIIAVNGKLLSNSSSDPKHDIAQLAKTARSLTLTIQPSNLLHTVKALLESSKTHVYSSSTAARHADR
jgi:S1-C subfamily serine protease